MDQLLILASSQFSFVNSSAEPASDDKTKLTGKVRIYCITFTIRLNTEIFDHFSRTMEVVVEKTSTEILLTTNSEVVEAHSTRYF